ncbi:hypothetical protein [Candidatus Villigracilis saccharophilus]|uniref:hypothetical protein n=1 Tax=Candidatus Villigracilis saccharophilus TaxID=3140684 RepID=UPI003135741A|nr:hypothetical protein [Anaerolineales bacterium]
MKAQQRFDSPVITLVVVAVAYAIFSMRGCLYINMISLSLLLLVMSLQILMLLRPGLKILQKFRRL